MNDHQVSTSWLRGIGNPWTGPATAGSHRSRRIRALGLLLVLTFCAAAFSLSGCDGMATVDPPTLQIDDGPPTPPVHSVVNEIGVAAGFHSSAVVELDDINFTAPGTCTDVVVELEDGNPYGGSSSCTFTIDNNGRTVVTDNSPIEPGEPPAIWSCWDSTSGTADRCVREDSSHRIEALNLVQQTSPSVTLPSNGNYAVRAEWKPLQTSIVGEGSLTNGLLSGIAGVATKGVGFTSGTIAIQLNPLGSNGFGTGTLTSRLGVNSIAWASVSSTKFLFIQSSGTGAMFGELDAQGILPTGAPSFTGAGGMKGVNPSQNAPWGAAMELQNNPTAGIVRTFVTDANVTDASTGLSAITTNYGAESGDMMISVPSGPSNDFPNLLHLVFFGFGSSSGPSAFVQDASNGSNAAKNTAGVGTLSAQPPTTFTASDFGNQWTFSCPTLVPGDSGVAAGTSFVNSSNDLVVRYDAVGPSGMQANAAINVSANPAIANSTAGMATVAAANGSYAIAGVMTGTGASAAFSAFVNTASAVASYGRQNLCLGSH